VEVIALGISARTASIERGGPASGLTDGLVTESILLLTEKGNFIFESS
jgi:hypothetical protein